LEERERERESKLEGFHQAIKTSEHEILEWGKKVPSQHHLKCFTFKINKLGCFSPTIITNEI
jgi:hypothetical protein